MNQFHYLVLSLSCLLYFSPSSLGQDVDKKLEEIDDPIDKITITSNGKEYTFEGEDAQNLFTKIKNASNTSKSFVMKYDDDDDETKKVIIISSDGDEEVIDITGDVDHEFIWLGEDDGELDELEKRVKIEVEDGKKKVTVTKNENGEEKTEVYEGEEADAYLEKMKSDSDNFFEFKLDDESGKKTKKIIIEKKKVDAETE